PDRRSFMPVSQHFLSFAPDQCIEPLVHAHPELLSGLARQLFGFRLDALELTKVARAMGAAANAWDLEIEVCVRLAFAHTEIDQIEGAADDPPQPNVARGDWKMAERQRRRKLCIGECQDLGKRSVAQPWRHAFVSDDDAATNLGHTGNLAKKSSDVGELTDTAELKYGIEVMVGKRQVTGVGKRKMCAQSLPR